MPRRRRAALTAGEKNERGPRHRATAHSYKYIMVPRLKLDFERAQALSFRHTVIVGEVRVYTHRRSTYGIQLKDTVPPVPNPSFE